MAFDAGALIAKLKLDNKGFNAGVKASINQMKGIDKQSKKTAGQFKNLGKVATGLGKTIGIGLGVTALGGLALGFKNSIKEAGRFEKSMANVATLVDTSIVSIEGLSESVLDMTSVVLKSADDLSAGLYQVFSAGISDSAEAMHVLEVSAKAATAGLSDTRTSVDAITTVINAYGLAAQDATEVSDLMFQTVKQGKTTFTELAGSIGTVISPAASLGIELEDLFATIATLTKGGIDTRVATTGLRAAFLSILKPGDKAIAMAKQLRIEWNADALRAKGLTKFLNDMKDATKGNTEQMSALIPEARALNVALALTGKQSKELNRILGEMENALGSTEEAFKKQTDTFDAQVKLFSLGIDKLQIKLGQLFLPELTDSLKGVNRVIGDITGSLEELGTMFDDLSGQIKNFATESDKVISQHPLFSSNKLQAASDRLKFFAKAALNLFTILNPIFKDSLAGIDKKTKETAQISEKAFERFKSVIIGITPAMEDMDQSLLDALNSTKAFPSVFNDAGEALGNAFTEVPKKLDEASKRLEQIGDLMGGLANEKAPMVISSLGNFNVMLGTTNELTDTTDTNTLQLTGTYSKFSDEIVMASADLKSYNTELALTKEQVKLTFAEHELGLATLRNVRERLKETSDASKSFGDNLSIGFKKAAESVSKHTQRITQNLPTDAIMLFGNSFSNAMGEFISGTKSAKDAFKDFAQGFIKELTAMITKVLVFNAIKSAGLVAFGAADGGIINGSFKPIQATPMANGGVFKQPTLGMVAEKPGLQEAVIPLKGGAVPVSINGGRKGDTPTEQPPVNIVNVLDPRQVEGVVIDVLSRDPNLILNIMGQQGLNAGVA